MRNIFLAVGLFFTASSTYALDVDSPPLASATLPGTFPAGGWTFAANSTVTVNSNFTKCLDVGPSLLTMNCLSGFLGIGSTSPTNFLDVNGGGIFRSSLTVTGNLQLVAGSTVSVNGGSLFFSTSTVVGGSPALMIQAGGNIGVGSTAPNTALDLAAGTLTTTGKVGIGTSSPGGSLAIQSAALLAPTGYDVKVSSQNGTTGIFVIQANGAIGIGSTSPVGIIHVAAPNVTVANLGAPIANSVTLQTTDNEAQDLGAAIGLGGAANSDGSNATNFGSVAGRKENGTTTDSSGYLAFATQRTGVGHSERMRITSLGLVGIGTSSPGSNLSVKGGATAFDVGTSTFIVTNGNVGIGSSSPAMILDVESGANRVALFGATLSTVSIPSNGVTSFGAGLHKLITTGAAGNGSSVSMTWSPACPVGSSGYAFDVTSATTPATMAYGTTSSTATFQGTIPNSDKIQFNIDCH